MSTGECLFVDRAVVLEYALQVSRSVESESTKALERVLSRYRRVLYERPGMSAAEHVLHAKSEISKALVAIGPEVDLGLDATEADELTEAVRVWSSKASILHAIQTLDRQRLGASRSVQEHVGYIVRLLLCAKRFYADLLMWRIRAGLLKALLEEVGFTVELTELSDGVRSLTADRQKGSVSPRALPDRMQVFWTMIDPLSSAGESSGSRQSETMSDERGPSGTPTIFISYSHEDEKWFDLVRRHLQPIVASGVVSAWSDRVLKVGSTWESEIRRAIDSAEIALLLVSPQFLASEFIMNVELPLLFKRVRAKQVKLVWIPISAALYETAGLTEYQSAVDPKCPLDMMPVPVRNRELVKICRAIGESTVSAKRDNATNQG